MIRRIVTAVALIAGLTVGAVVAAPDAASAYCIGGSAGTYDTGWGRESVRWASTCDGQGDYYGRILDTAHDGYCVLAEFDASSGYHWFINCSETTWLNFSFTDNDANARFRLCKYKPGGGIQAHPCTAWHSNYGF